VRRAADDFHFEVQASVVRSRDRIREAGRNREVGTRKTLLEDPRRADGAADFLVVREVKLDGPMERAPLALSAASANA
jgi:hypothetical protein